MHATAKLKNARISPQKVRLVATAVRGLPVEEAEQVLAFNPQKAAHIVKKVLLSAVANAEHNEGADIDELHVHEVLVDQGPSQSRFRARARGRINRILRRTSHISLTVADKRAR